VNSLIASPLTKGLFVRAIAQSGPISTFSITGDSDAERRSETSSRRPTRFY
jgi:carboxylesterase type B